MGIFSAACGIIETVIVKTASHDALPSLRKFSPLGNVVWGLPNSSLAGNDIFRRNRDFDRAIGNLPYIGASSERATNPSFVLSKVHWQNANWKDQY